jgi:hypothetical protein
MFRDLHVQHLADFFRDQQDGLAALAPHSTAASSRTSCC